jgi:hypothetical protein
MKKPIEVSYLILTYHITLLVLDSMFIADEIGKSKEKEKVVRIRVTGRVEPFDDTHARGIVEAVRGTKKRIAKGRRWHKIVSANLMAVNSESWGSVVSVSSQSTSSDISLRMKSLDPATTKKRGENNNRNCRVQFLVRPRR